MKKERIFWGIYFILGALFILAARMGYMEDVSFWSLIWTVFIAAILIKSVIKINFFGIFMSLAFLGIIYATPLGITAIVPWPLLGAALFISIGCSMIFPKKHRFKFDSINRHKHRDFEEVINEEDGQNINYSVSFGSCIKYINSDDFQYASLECSFGAMNVYFDNAIMQKSEATVHVDNSFGGMELYFPKNWLVINQMDSAFGGVDEKGHAAPDGLHKVYLQGDNSFGGITIYYI